MRFRSEELAKRASKHEKRFSRQQISLWRHGHGAHAETLAVIADLEHLSPAELGVVFFAPDDSNATLERKNAVRPPDEETHTDKVNPS